MLSLFLSGLGGHLCSLQFHMFVVSSAVIEFCFWFEVSNRSNMLVKNINSDAYTVTTSYMMMLVKIWDISRPSSHWLSVELMSVVTWEECLVSTIAAAAPLLSKLCSNTVVHRVRPTGPWSSGPQMFCCFFSSARTWLASERPASIWKLMATVGSSNKKVMGSSVRPQTVIT